MYDINTTNETWEWVNLKEVIMISVFLLVLFGETMNCCLKELTSYLGTLVIYMILNVSLCIDDRYLREISDGKVRILGYLGKEDILVQAVEV